MQKTRRRTRETPKKGTRPRLPERERIRYAALLSVAQKRAERLIVARLAPVVAELDRVDALTSFDERFAALNDELDELADDLLGPLFRVGRDVARHAERDVARTLALPIRATSGTLDAAAELFVRDNVALIKSVHSDQLGRMFEIVNAFQRGQANQKSLRNQIMDAFGLSRSRSALIARDQVLKTNAAITQLRQTEVGVTEYVWRTAQDERVRGKPGGKWGPRPGRSWSGGNHWDLDGQRFRWDSPPIVDPRTGRRAHPGQDFQCRCVAEPVVPGLARRTSDPATLGGVPEPLVAPAPQARPRSRRRR